MHNYVSRAGLHFGPTPNGKEYISVFHHRGSGSKEHKKTWHSSVSPDDEYGIFLAADLGDWSTPDGHYWGVAEQGMRVIGTLGERVCKFPLPANATDAWHGYPVSPLLDEDDVLPDDFVKAWMDAGVVTRTIGSRLMRWKI